MKVRPIRIPERVRAMYQWQRACAPRFAVVEGFADGSSAYADYNAEEARDAVRQIADGSTLESMAPGEAITILRMAPPPPPDAIMLAGRDGQPAGYLTDASADDASAEALWAAIGRAVASYLDAGYAPTADMIDEVFRR